ncbi:hypothetical protein [Nannocystis radixulma]|uniref:Uncharacterized protein n=1 Tax=Nannocystis radixulma TaxID=2995305 RepID=A0ABT5BCD4_9BACT|nr:hypothetical protein [Nannocystis radixulma]MDC0670671.1 hypothetical protein [Nannocystis radixulma]
MVEVVGTFVGLRGRKGQRGSGRDEVVRRFGCEGRKVGGVERDRQRVLEVTGIGNVAFTGGRVVELERVEGGERVVELAGGERTAGLVRGVGRLGSITGRRVASLGTTRRGIEQLEIREGERRGIVVERRGGGRIGG